MADDTDTMPPAVATNPDPKPDFTTPPPSPAPVAPPTPPVAEKPKPVVKTAKAPEAKGAAADLRAFEDEKFGKDAVRINGLVERGSGSPFSRMSDADKEAYAALERLQVAEDALADARVKLSVAEAEHAEAGKVVERARADASKADADAKSVK